MYFPNAFKKVLPAAVDGGAIDHLTSGDTTDLTAGQIGLFNAKTYAAISAAPGTNTPFIIAMGSYHTNDKVGPFHGGYQESVKSKVINPKYVSRFIKVAAVTAQNQIIAVGWDVSTDGDSNATTFDFVCGRTYSLRLDLKGSPALRFLNHQIYHTLDAYSGCCDDNCNSTCTGDPVDPVYVMLQWKDQITQDPILSKFITSKVYYRNPGVSPAIGKTEALSEYDVEVAGSGTAYTPVTDENTIATIQAGLEITVAYADTRFGECTFTVTDHYELEPIKVYASVVDDTNNPCAARPTGNSSTGELVTETQAPRQASGTGDKLIREYILSQRYLQEPFHDSNHVDRLRIREIEGSTAFTAVTPTTLYDHILLLHNVPRLNNPSGTFDNDQYLIDIAVPTGTTTTSLTNLLSSILTNAGNGVALENL
jgi:hypothetical protein